MGSSTVKETLLAILVIVGILFIYQWTVTTKRRRDSKDQKRLTSVNLVIGFVTNFFDTLGIGSFALTTAVFKILRSVSDEKIPGTLNVGHALPILTQALVFIAAVHVDMLTLISMILASVAGAWLGAGFVAKWPKRMVQLGMGGALLVAGVLFTLANLKLFPSGGEALALSGPQLAFGIIGNFILGALMTLGIGLYAPCMILVSILGMNPVAAFPIMMGSCALLMPVGSMRFFKAGAYHPGAALALTLGGIPAVLIAAYVVKSLPLETVRWLVIFVVTYTSIMMLKDGIQKPRK